MRSFLALAVTFIFASQANAARTVTVTLDDNKALQITNPTASAVSYDVRCYDSTGSQVVNEAAQTLSANTTRYVGADGRCAGGAAPIDVASTNAGPFRCAGTNIQYATAGSVCGGFYTVCNIQQVSAVSPSPTGNGHWVAPGTNPWYYRYSYASMTTVSDNTSTLAPLVKSMGSGNSCQNSSSTMIGENCYASAPTTNADGAYCCANGTSIAFCKVTVNTTSSTAYLTSPQFKGGAPF